MDFTVYTFNAGWTDPTIVLNLGLTFESMLQQKKPRSNALRPFDAAPLHSFRHEPIPHALSKVPVPLRSVWRYPFVSCIGYEAGCARIQVYVAIG
jgi:hypothetical protein